MLAKAAPPSTVAVQQSPRYADLAVNTDIKGVRAILEAVDSGVPDQEKFDVDLPVGRTIWIEPLEGAFSGWKIKAKGFGLADHNRRFKLPSSKPYHRIHEHVGVAPDGTLYRVSSDPAPMGGMIATRASTEYEVAKRLSSTGVTGVAIAALRNTEVLFNPSDYSTEASIKTHVPLGAVVTLVPHSAELASRYHLHAQGGDGGLGYLSDVAGGLGHALRTLHQAGYYRFSGYPRNYAVADGRVVLIDLDSLREFSVSCRTPIQAALHRTRDIASALYGLICTTTTAEAIEVTPNDAATYSRLFSSLLCAYYSPKSTPLSVATGQLVDINRMARENATACHEATPEGSRKGVPCIDYSEYRRRRYQQYWIERFTVYRDIFHSLMPLASDRERSMGMCCTESLSARIACL